MRLVGVALAIAMILGAASARAQSSAPPGNAAHEAQVHFERGLTLADDNNFVAAMIEFRYAYQLTHNPLVLYNIALALQSLGQYVEALDAYRSYEHEAGGEVTGARRAQIATAITRLENRIATIRVAVDMPEMQLEIDGVAHTAAEARSGVRVSVGRHRILLAASGRRPRETQMDVVSGATVDITEPLDSMMSSIDVRSNVSDAQVRVDGVVVATTPVNVSLPVSEGRHRIEITRLGYVPFVTMVDATRAGARLDATLDWSPALPMNVAAALHFDLHPHDAHASIDGRPIDPAANPVVPPGRHLLHFDHANFNASDLGVTLAPGERRSLAISLAPTREIAAQLNGRRSSAMRVTAIGGVMLVVNVIAILTIAPIQLGTSGPVFQLGTGFLIFAPSAVTGAFMLVSGLVHRLRSPTVEQYQGPAVRASVRFTPRGIEF